MTSRAQTSLAPRTRAFAAILKLLVSEPASADQMVDLRARRERLRRTPAGQVVFGRPSSAVDTADVEIETGSRLHVHRPTGAAGPLPIVVNFHGGGWCIGTPEQSAWLASHVAELTGSVVVSPTYRLAPEHPYPAAVEDAWAALCWVAEHAAELGGDPARIAVMGDSAGGNLAAVTALMARDAGGPALRAQVLVYPAVEMYERYPSEEANAHPPVLTSKQMHTFGHLYLGASYGIEDWQASPIRAASHAGLPPALILTAFHDPLRDHGAKYAEVLRAAGSEAEVRDYSAGIHGFVSLPGVVPAAREALSDVAAFLNGRL
ncbi:alpha/beta hydrolase [Nocardioides sp. CER19]|uniref:alpha/beta hydrolase n=1 Tax=Nocardioides sp. CER19 TaxID=3038538 RepID=UPI0024492115|nr:alpha/beta hydrolase [Nocardioides sp. CER19]MDH2414743.1 alpha/beta hydrolase [Nocardioides sp. CER19]